LADILKRYDGNTDIVLIIEPDSLPNLSTNAANPSCGNSATVNAYTKGIPYAVNTLKDACPSCQLYLDAAHGGWLGWTDNLTAFFRDIAAMNIVSKLRGFAQNVANYQPIGPSVCPWSPDWGNPWRNNYCLNG
jgi:cellulose 1,4-beta-cellobiosidase